MLSDAVNNITTAIATGRTDVVKSIIDTVRECESKGEGYDLSAKALLDGLTTNEGSILHFAIKKGDKDAVRSLLSAGADPCVKNATGQTAADLATACIAAGNTDMVAVLNEELLQSVAHSNVSRVSRLLASGIDVCCRDSADGLNTPLHWAAAYGNESIVICLLDHGADANLTNKQGCTPLHDAVARGEASIVGELMMYGADPTVQASSGKFAGKTAIDIATSRARDDLVRVLTEPLAHKRTENGHQDVVPAAAAELKAEVSHIGSAATDDQPVVTGDHPAIAAARVRLKLLWPPPKKMSVLGGRSFRHDGRLVVAAVCGPDVGMVHDIISVWLAKATSFEDLAITLVTDSVPYQMMSPLATGHPTVVCLVDSKLFLQAESYRLTMTETQVRITASDLAGLHYAVATFIQMLTLFNGEEIAVPCVQITDWPHLKTRGVLLDLSAGRVPHEEALWELVDRCSLLKLNEVHVYVRFRYNASETAVVDLLTMWPCAYPRSSLIELDRFCKHRHVTLVPVLDVGPKVTHDTLGLLYPAFNHFVSCFSVTRVVHAGPRLSALVLDVDEVTGDVSSMSALPLSEGRLVQLSSTALKGCRQLAHGGLDLCGEVSRAVLKRLPFNLVLMEHVRSAADIDSNAATVRCFEESGVSYCLCPGTTAYNSFAGRPDDAIKTIQSAVRRGVEHGALGVLICDWSGEAGHATDRVFGLPAIVAAAALTWDSTLDLDTILSCVSSVLDLHVLDDVAATLGRVIVSLGRIESELTSTLNQQQLPLTSNQQLLGQWSSSLGDGGATVGSWHGSNGDSLRKDRSLLLSLLLQPDDVDIGSLKTTDLQRVVRRLRAEQCELIKAEPYCYHGAAVTSQLRVTIDLMLAASRIGIALIGAGRNPTATGLPVANIGIANLPPTTKTDLANRLLEIFDAYKLAWLERFEHTASLSKSLATVFGIIKSLLPDSVDIASRLVLTSTKEHALSAHP